jgi:hypothetical protein
VRAGAWFSVLLCLIAAAGGLFLLALTLGRPFLPPNWLP